MPRRATLPDTLCPLGRCAELLGDRATLLILRELFRGCRRFELLALNTALRPQLVSTRLKRLRADGVVETRVYQPRPLRHEYWLTPKGRALFSIMLAMRNWAEQWAYAPGETTGEPIIRFVHQPCGADIGLSPICPKCGTVPEHEDLGTEFSEPLKAEYAARAARDISREPRRGAAQSKEGSR